MINRLISYIDLYLSNHTILRVAIHSQCSNIPYNNYHLLLVNFVTTINTILGSLNMVYSYSIL